MSGTRALALALFVLGALAGCSGDGEGDELGLGAHDRWFRVGGADGGSAHAAFTCDRCHDPAAQSFSAAGLPGDRPGQSCLPCHEAPAVAPVHADVSGFAYVNAQCIDCHRDGTISGALPPDHDVAGFPVTGTPHARIGCSSCHAAGRPRNDPAHVTCVPCHDRASMASAHARIPATTTGQRDRRTYSNYAYPDAPDAPGASLACLRCHVDGRLSIAEHPRVPHGITGEDHAPFCLTCHQSQRTGAKPWGADFRTFTCLACHSDNQGGGGGEGD